VTLSIGARRRLVIDGLVSVAAPYDWRPQPMTEPRELVCATAHWCPVLALHPDGSATSPGSPSLIVENPFRQDHARALHYRPLQITACRGRTQRLRRRRGRAGKCRLCGRRHRRSRWHTDRCREHDHGKLTQSCCTAVPTASFSLGWGPHPARPARAADRRAAPEGACGFPMCPPARRRRGAIAVCRQGPSDRAAALHLGCDTVTRAMRSSVRQPTRRYARG